MQITSPSGQCAKLLWSRLLVCRISRFIAVVKTTVAQVQKVHFCGEKPSLLQVQNKNIHCDFWKPFSTGSKVLINNYIIQLVNFNYKNIKHVQVYKAPWAVHCKIDASLMQTTTSLSPPQKLKCSQTNENTYTHKKNDHDQTINGCFCISIFRIFGITRPDGNLLVSLKSASFRYRLLMLGPRVGPNQPP